jgi:Cthe_2314-like HEPN
MDGGIGTLGGNTDSGSRSLPQDYERRTMSLHDTLVTHPLTIKVAQNAARLYAMISAKIRDCEAMTSAKIRDRGKRSKERQTPAQQVLTELRASDPTLYREFVYHNEIFQHTSNLLLAIQRLEMTPIFLKRFPRTATFDKHHITIHRWIQYHYSNYVVTMTSIYDTALLMVNGIFGLGVEPKNCREKTVADHARVKKFRVQQPLHELASIVKPYCDPRHLLVHRNIMPGLSGLDDLDRLRFLNEVGEAYHTKAEPLLSPRFVTLFYNTERRQLAQEVVKASTRLTDSVYVLFDALHPVYAGGSFLITQDGHATGST